MTPAPADPLTTLSRTVIQAFDDLNGPHPGFRPTHAKGILLSGTFTPSPDASSLTRAPHVQRRSTPVTVRYSDFGGIPSIPDSDPNASPRGIAIRFHLAEHSHTDIIAHSVDGFPTRTVEEFVEFLHAALASGPNAAKPAPIELFLGAHPAALAFVQVPKPVPASFAQESFFAVTAYKFTNPKGVSRFGRYRIRPDGGGEYLAPEAAAAKPANFLFDEIGERLGKGPVKLQIMVQVAEDGDVVDDATEHWPDSRPEIAFGTVEVTGVAPNNDAEERQIIFDPIPRVDGIESSGDPLLEPRAAIYLMSGRRRRAEGGK
jgi:catalase